MAAMPEISEHAILRYLERIYHVDMDAIRAEMRCAGLITAQEIGCSTVILGNGARLKLQGDVVVTVLPTKSDDRRRKRGKR